MRRRFPAASPRGAGRRPARGGGRRTSGLLLGRPRPALGTRGVKRGELVVLLHAHLPWVRHPELPFFLEEHWLFEAVFECYLPLVEALRALERDGVPVRLTVDVSPTLAAMLEDPLLRGRTAEFGARLLRLCRQEEERTRGDRAFSDVVAFYRKRLTRLLDLYERLGRDLNGELARLERAGLLELATCAATHPILPSLLDRPELARGQIRTAVREHERIFGRRPRGIWLPECAYAPPLDRYLAEADLRWFAVDAHGLLSASPSPRYGIYAPCWTEHGVAVFARDVASAREVWSARGGYPGDPVYREFYRDVGWDLPFEQIAPFIDPSGQRMFTGLKYYRITGETEAKEPYDPRAARARALEHGDHFVARRREQARDQASRMDRPPVLFCPYDAELFGHWWFEGPWFLERVFRSLAAADDLDPATPGDVLARAGALQVVDLEPSSWGAGGHLAVWLDESNEWCLPHLTGIGERLAARLEERDPGDAAKGRILRQAVREAMLAQASDWPFLMSTGTAVEYATRRFTEHVQRFNRLDGMLGRVALEGDDRRFLELCEERDGLFPSLDLADFA
ncbi:MAG: DUF1957 domain-containing protein [Acidobacteria bacterium]|nr:MAG: DUF1957 domain-containing protein [Acidobacteriota bacterium]